ncbi:MAG TPA: hypothetical protein VKS98_09095 [Chthoniobacterales bacterium]|nr:hypothetical protein [Chthoniobacterales bacterium]
MIKKSIFWLTTIIVLGAGALFAQDKPAQGTVTLSKKTWQLSQGVAYETTVDGEDRIIIVLSNQPITAQALKAARAAEKKGEFPEFKKPNLRIEFKKSGELIQWNGTDNNTSVAGVTGEGAKTELKVENGRAIGKLSHPLDPSQMIPRSADVKFNVALMKANEDLPASASTAQKTGGPAANVKPTVTGTFTGNGKDAKLNYVSARWTEPFDNKPGILLLFTEKDHSKARKPDNDAMFGHYGNALIISLHEDGSIYSCQVVHNGMKNKGFSSSGSIEATPFTYENGKVEGEITTNGDVDTFGEKWGVKLKFVAPLGEIPKEYQVAEEKPAAEQSKPNSDDADGEMATAMANAMAMKSKASNSSKSGPGEARPAAPGLNIKDLALTKDASDFEYKALVEMMSCKSKLPVKAACAELAKNLKGQGWISDGSDLITSKSSILKRKRGPASLTIFVKPDDGGSKIDITTEGLDWEKAEN